MKPGQLLARLEQGAGADEAELRGALDLGAEAADGDLASALVRKISEQQIARAKVTKKRRRDPRASDAPDVVSAVNSSFLGRLSVVAGEGEGSEDKLHVGELEDAHVLLSVLRAGTLPQRRAAALRLAHRLGESALSNEELRAVSTTLHDMRAVEIDFEVSRAREALPGARGRQARKEAEELEPVLEKLIAAIDEFWSGQRATDPVAELKPDRRAQLMVGLRDTPDVLPAHIGSVLDGSDGVSTKEARHAALTSIRYAGDPRLVPPLVGLLRAGQPDFGVDAARALARIDDPRVHPALATAYERSVTDIERVVFAGALGLVGDVRGCDYVRSHLASDDERVLLAAVEAMESLATSEDCERLIPLLERDHPQLLAHVIRALGRTGDARALLPLGQLRRESGLSALWADAEESEAEIRAQMELRGEEPPELEESLELATAAESGLAERKRDPMIVRLKSWWDFMMGNVWLGLGASRRAVRRFERAAGRRPGWAVPLAALAMHHARKERPAQALAAFRRALEANRSTVEGNLIAIRVLARIFLRRAEEVEKIGRVDIARGLIEEVLTLDLRRIPSELRFELTRRQEQLRMRGAT